MRHLLGQAQHLVPRPLGSTAVLVHIILKWFKIAIHVLYKYLLHSNFVLYLVGFRAVVIRDALEIGLA